LARIHCNLLFRIELIFETFTIEDVKKTIFAASRTTP
jgi:hypothetical protein